MRRDKPSSEPANEPSSQPARESPLSLGRLREAFAAMLGGSAEDEGDRSRVSPKLGMGSFGETALRQCEINPRSVVEAMLFVGRPDNRPLSARELAAAMRGVSPSEIESAVKELNSIYDADRTPYRIEHNKSGYRMVLREEFERMRDKFYGRVKEARLSPPAIEVLSILAYNQPATADQLNEIRGAPSSGPLSTLVRRRLVKIERSSEPGALPHYLTTERFLKLFGLESLEALPRAEDLGNV